MNCILEDRQGNFWFATHHHGVCRYDGSEFVNFTNRGETQGVEVWSLYEDRAGNIWFPAEGFGVYRYDGTGFANFHRPDGLESHAIQCLCEDREGRLWAGGYLGLFRKEGRSFVTVTTDGPWQSPTRQRAEP